MPINAADWSVNRTTGAIRYIGDGHLGASPSYATVLEFHRWLQDLADNAEFTGDDQVDITVLTPSDRSTDNIITLLNGFNIDYTASQHLYDGSIIQSNGDEFYDGIVNFGNSGVKIQIIQDGALLGGGSPRDDWWNVTGPGSPLTVVGLNASADAGISHRFMVKTRTGGADIDGRRLIGTTRTFGNTYSEFKINGSSRGNNVLALSDSTDLNNTTAIGTVATWDDVTNLSEGYTGIDINNDGTPEYYYSEWDFGSRTVNQFYERLKYLTRDESYYGSPKTSLYGLSGEVFRGITHQFTINGVTGTWPATGLVQWSTGTAQMLAFGSPATDMWVQLLTGVVPTNGQTIEYGSPATATATLNVTVTSRTVSTPFVGASTGSALIGSYGLGVQTTNTSASDTFFDLTNTAITPPNNVTFTVSGVKPGEDRVLVTNDLNTGIDTTQLKLATTLSSASETAVVTTTAIPTDTPSSGTIRVVTDNSLERRLVYSSYTGSTFTLAPPGSPANGYDFTADNATATAGSPPGVYVTYVDKLIPYGSPQTLTTASFTVVYLADRTLFIRVRDGGTAGDLQGIKTFETTGTITSTGGSATVIRTADA